MPTTDIPKVSHTSLSRGSFSIPAQERVVFGHPAHEAVLAEVQACGARRVFVISGRSLNQMHDGPLQRVVRALGDRHAGTFAKVSAHSPREEVIAAATEASAAGADLLVAVGGGSVIDTTKAMLMCLWMGLDSPERMECYRVGASRAQPIMAPRVNPLRMMAVSTTLSASEFTSSAGVTDSATQAKQSFHHRLFVPRCAVLDPAATLDTPDWLLFCTGIRAVDHAIESYCSLFANPATEMLSLNGLRLLVNALPRIKASPHDLVARLDAQFGMWHAISAAGAGAGTGASHGIGYALGAGYGVAHGHTSCVMLPAVLQWNARVNAQRQQALSHACGVPHQNASELVAQLVETLGLPGNLRAVNIARDQLQHIAKQAMSYSQVLANPRPITRVQDVQEILELAW